MSKRKHPKDESLVLFGQQLAKIRKEKHLTQKQVACQLQVERSTYAYHEIGRTQLTLSCFVKIADAIGIPPQQLLEIYLQCRKEK